MTSRKPPRLDEPLSPTKTVVRTVRLPPALLEQAQDAADTLNAGNRTAFVERAVLEHCAKLGVGSPGGEPMDFVRVPEPDEVGSGNVQGYIEELIRLEEVLIKRIASDVPYVLDEDHQQRLIRAAARLVDCAIKTPADGGSE